MYASNSSSHRHKCEELFVYCSLKVSKTQGSSTKYRKMGNWFQNKLWSWTDLNSPQKTFLTSSIFIENSGRFCLVLSRVKLWYDTSVLQYVGILENTSTQGLPTTECIQSFVTKMSLFHGKIKTRQLQHSPQVPRDQLRANHSSCTWYFPWLGRQFV